MLKENPLTPGKVARVKGGADLESAGEELKTALRPRVIK